jgi:hypothetical protein
MSGLVSEELDELALRLLAGDEISVHTAHDNRFFFQSDMLLLDIIRYRVSLTTL